MTDTENKNLGGRPEIYNKELRDEICRRLADGESLRSICRDDEMPSRPTIAKWAYENIGELKDDTGKVIVEGFFYHYTRARDIGLDVMADDVLDISDDSHDDYTIEEDKNGNVKTVLNKEAVMRSRLRVDSRKWYLAKMAPKRYGDTRMLMHQQLDKDGENTDPATVTNNITVDGEAFLKASTEAFEKAMAGMKKNEQKAT